MAGPIIAFTRKELTLLVVVFTLGVILGATLLNVYAGIQIDRLIFEKNELTSRVEEQDKQIKELEKNIEQYKQHSISKITVKLQTEVNKHTEQEISKKIRQLLAGLLGRDTRQIDPLLLRDVINDRLIEVGGETYHLELLFMVITNELELYFKVSLPQRQEEE